MASHKKKWRYRIRCRIRYRIPYRIPYLQSSWDNVQFLFLFEHLTAVTKMGSDLGTAMMNETTRISSPHLRAPCNTSLGAVTFFLKTEFFLRIFGKIRKYFEKSENISDFPRIFRKIRKILGKSEIFSDYPRMRFSCSEECVTDVPHVRICFPGGNMPFGRSLTLFIIVSAGAIPL